MAFIPVLIRISERAPVGFGHITGSTSVASRRVQRRIAPIFPALFFVSGSSVADFRGLRFVGEMATYLAPATFFSLTTSAVF